jgi:hypothetical protein
MSAYPAKHRIIRAELIGSDMCTAAGLTAQGHVPALAVCRKLLAAGYNPRCELHVYRDGTLALRIRSIGEGARLTVEECSDGKPRFRSYRPHPSAGSPPIAQNDCPATSIAEAAE